MSSSDSTDPRAEYQARLADRLKGVAHLKAWDNRISLLRGIVFLGGVVLGIACIGLQMLTLWWLLPPVLIFVVLVLFHESICDRLARMERAVLYYQTALNRLDEKWKNDVATGDRYLNPDHAYSGDLDLFGQGSLFQFLSTARTRLGEDRLANWLTRGADVETIRARQTAVEELRPNLELRENLAVLGANVHDALDQNQLRAWVTEPAQPVSRTQRILALVLTAAVITALAGWWFFQLRLSYVIISLVVESLFLIQFRRQLTQLAATADEADSGLSILSEVLGVLEHSDFSSPLLSQIPTKIETDGQLPSREVARLHILIQRLNNCLQNQFYAPVAFILGLPVHLVHAIESWRIRVGPHIDDWLEAVAEFEAISSLGGYAFEHPQDPFPELLETGAIFEGDGLGHPLLSEKNCVRNDVMLGDLQLLLISGSNMSGKSTLLRTVGINAVLAQMGAPVRAKRMRLSSVQLGSAMRIQDSLQDGRSLFYSAVSRIKTMIDLTDQQLPVLFLLDEVLMGTNSHDRRIGSEGILRKLIECGSIGLLTTHDLELTKIVPSFGTRAKNVHFEDQLIDGRMTFDYHLREGVVEKSNALELMRMVGLDV